MEALHNRAVAIFCLVAICGSLTLILLHTLIFIFSLGFVAAESAIGGVDCIRCSNHRGALLGSAALDGWLGGCLWELLAQPMAEVQNLVLARHKDKNAAGRQLPVDLGNLQRNDIPRENEVLGV